jgi:hypothetical protein
LRAAGVLSSRGKEQTFKQKIRSGRSPVTASLLENLV